MAAATARAAATERRFRFLQGFVNADNLFFPGSVDLRYLGRDRHMNRPAASPIGLALPGKVDDYRAHRTPRVAHEVNSIFYPDLPAFREPKIGFVHQCRRIEYRIAPACSQARASQLAQVLIGNFEERVGCL
jgi:hypothetical protein